MHLSRLSLVLLLLISPVASLPVVDFDQNSNQQTIPIKFWSVDPREYQILDIHIFPMAIINPSGSFENLGKAWVTWEIKFENQELGVFAIYNRGKLQNFTVLNKLFDDILWYGIEEQLLVVGILKEETTFYVYGLSNLPPPLTLEGNYTDHQVFFSPLETFLYVYDIDDEVSRFFYPSPIVTRDLTSNEVVTNTAPTMAIIESPDGKRVLYTSIIANITIPENLGQNLQIGHIRLNPAIIDLSTQQLWSEEIGFISLPKNSENVYFFGKKSSIIRTSNNSLWELGQIGWEKITTLGIQTNDFAIIDSGLYIGPIIHNGVSLIAAGLDEDRDGIPSTMEDYYGSLSTQVDTDGDGISDQLEISFGTDPNNVDGHIDSDKDRLSNAEEFELGLDPVNPDTDYGGALDGWELKYDFDPFSPMDDKLDPDNDGVNNAEESLWNTDPFNEDSDQDQMPDSWEILYLLNPLNSNDAMEDPDGDGLSNLDEYKRQKDPFSPNRPTIFEGMWLVIIFITIIMLIPTIITYKKLIRNKS